MNQPITGKGSSFSSTTKSKIIAAVDQLPGRTGREIASALGLDKSSVNSFLYGEGKRLHGLVESEYRWYPKSMLLKQRPFASKSTVQKGSRPSVASSPTSQRPLASPEDNARQRTPLHELQEQRQAGTIRPQKAASTPAPIEINDSRRLTNSICGMLAQMDQTQAALKIRQMPLNLIGVAFGEDDYPLLDDRLKIELVMRKKDLESRPAESTTLTKRNTTPWPWILLALIGGFMLVQHFSRHQVEPRGPLLNHADEVRGRS